MAETTSAPASTTGMRERTTRSETLAMKLEKTIEGLLAAVEASTPEQWAAPCSDGEWTQAFAAYHAATTIGVVAQVVKDVAGGQPFPKMTMEELDSQNAAQAKEHADCTTAETIALIKESTPIATSVVRSLSDEQLDRKIQLLDSMPEVTVEMMAEMGLVGHAGYHLQTITGAR